VSKKWLILAVGIGVYAMAHLARNEHLRVEALIRIYDYLDLLE